MQCALCTRAWAETQSWSDVIEPGLNLARSWPDVDPILVSCEPQSCPPDTKPPDQSVDQIWGRCVSKVRRDVDVVPVRCGRRANVEQGSSVLGDEGEASPEETVTRTTIARLLY